MTSDPCSVNTRTWSLWILTSRKSSSSSSSSIIHRLLFQIYNRWQKHTDLFYFHTQLNSLDWSRSRSRSFWSRSHNSFLVSGSVSVLVSHSLVSVLALILLCFGLINKPACLCKSCCCFLSFFLHCGHGKCLANLVSPVHVSTLIFLCNRFVNNDGDLTLHSVLVSVR